MQGYEDHIEDMVSGLPTELARQIWMADELQATMANYLKGTTTLEELETVVNILKAKAGKYNVDINGVADLIFGG
jgi:hypothetical protein